MAESPLARHASTPAELKQRLEAEEAGEPFLVLRDPRAGQVLIRLDGSRTRLTIGRRPENDIALAWDDRSSRLHAELHHAGGEWMLVDDGISSNGTWIGDTRVVGRRRLRHGDVIRIGGTLIAFSAPGDARQGTQLADDTGTTLSLTPAQRRVLVALCRPQLLGNAYAAQPSNAQLAGELFLSVDSIKTHMKALFDAFGLNETPQAQKRATLVERAVRMGLVTERDVAQG
jgi:pSer/pThr/pTyr-binding forkhead associated (FHA) protein